MRYLIGLCLRGQDPHSPQTRLRCGTIAGGLGILLNLLLSCGKLLAGFLTGSRLAGQEADAEHPFGHGRIEYVSGLIVSLAILLMGIEVARSSLDSLFHGAQVQSSPLAVAILCAAILVKLWMFWFNRTLGRTIGSAAIEATAADSLSDTASTAVVLLSTLVSPYLNFPLDGLAGLLVAAFILKTGWDAARDTLDPLLGRPMDPELAADIDRIVLSHDKILGIHDLVYHDYGPGRAMMSFHAEVPADGDFLEYHDLIDHIERELSTTT